MVFFWDGVGDNGLFLAADLRRVRRPRFVVKPRKPFFSAIYAPTAGSGPAPLTCSYMTIHFPSGSVVSMRAHLPKAAFRDVGSSPAKLLIQTHQKASSTSTLLTPASSPGSSLDCMFVSLRCDCELWPRIVELRGGSILSGGKRTGTEAVLPFSSANPEERKSAHEGVVGRAKSELYDRAKALTPCGASRDG